MAGHVLRVAARLAQRLVQPLILVFAFVLPPLLVVAYGLVSVTMQNFLAPAPAIDRALPEPPAYDPAKPIAVVVAGNMVTEVSDLLGPYEVLAASDAFNVYVVAPERRPAPLVPVPLQHCCADLDIVPHYSFDEYDRTIGVAPDLIVVPYIPRAAQEDAAVLTWLRERPSEQTVILSICGGAQMVADAGLLAGRTATSHHITLAEVERTHPEVNWVRGLRYVDDGRFISSAGVTSGVDATLYTLQRFVGRDATLETARRIGYPHTRFLDDPTWVVPTDSDIVALPNLFRGDRTRIGLFLYPGVDEIAISSVTDTYPRALATDVLTIGAEREIIRTRHGLDLIPRHSLASVSDLDRLLVPGQPDATAAVIVDGWSTANMGRPAERIHGAGYPYDATFTDLAQQQTRLIALNAARWIEYPTAQLTLGGRDWQIGLVFRAFGVGVLGVLTVLGVQRLLRLRRRPVVSIAANGAGRRPLGADSQV